MSGLLTNAASKVALKTLRTAEASLDRTQSRISTGLKVAKAGDNAAFFLVANTTRGDINVFEGQRENLTYAQSAVRTALAAQTQIDDAILNIKSAVVSLETGSAEAELDRIIQEQIEIVRDVVADTSFNGVNLLERDNTETFVLGYDREGDSLDFNTLTLQAQGLGIRPNPIDVTAPPIPGSIINLNSEVDLGAPGLYGPTNLGSIAGVNVGLGGGGVAERTFAISFETGADVTTEQVIFEEGGGVRGLNISIRNGQLVFGGYNLPNDGTTPWPFQEVQVGIEANTRYTAQLVLDGDAAATGQLRAYLDGTFVDSANNVGILYNHGNPIGLGRISGNAVVNGVIKNRDTDPVTGNDFQGAIDKVVLYNELFNAAEFDQITTYLAEGWLPERGVAYYVGSPTRLNNATLVELLDAVTPVDQEGFSTDAALEVLEAAQQKSNRAFAQLGFYESRLDSQEDFLYDLTDALEEGVAALVEADLAEESARVQAFQVQTDLARQSLFIANSRPQNLLRLFN